MQTVCTICIQAGPMALQNYLLVYVCTESRDSFHCVMDIHEVRSPRWPAEYWVGLTQSPNRSQETIERYSDEPQRRSRSLIKFMTMCLGCVLVSAAVVIMEAFSLLALQFCDGENLMSLYWSTWTMIQVGSLIAMMGIILAMAHSLRNRRHPYVTIP